MSDRSRWQCSGASSVSDLDHAFITLLNERTLGSTPG
eukprot:CAMPEP_0194050148 /NCGR_PEP_ID=MMETSP0009_2-20130614/33429_1 /TAXON_ID=210454 /ORGANISM="Grammatophora oceanica, Strain CCMP 410" /LENGTH=36 /DNA_ID= /DNA_START= /DNA_END= /DNA_ORIENTATION=